MHGSVLQPLHPNLSLSYWGIYVILDKDLAGRSHLEIAREVIAGGARVIQYRHKDALPDELLEVGKALRELTRRSGVTLIVNDHPNIAVALDADGVHVGQEDVSPHEARNIVGPHRIVGLSTHTLEQAVAALQAPVDYIGVGPVYPTTTKKNAWPVVGVELVRTVKAQVPLPIVAIGGVTESRIPELVEAGADNIALIGDLMRAPDLQAKMRSLLRTYDAAKAAQKRSA